MRAIAAATAVLLIFLDSAMAQNRCAAELLKSYNSLNVTLLNNGELVMTAKTLIAQRRLQEGYCHELAICNGGDPEVESKKTIYHLNFAKCLRDEALEKYDARPR